jgi:hypothetical protein
MLIYKNVVRVQYRASVCVCCSLLLSSGASSLRRVIRHLGRPRCLLIVRAPPPPSSSSSSFGEAIHSLQHSTHFIMSFLSSKAVRVLRVTSSRSSPSSPFRTTTIRHGTSKSFVSKHTRLCFFCCHMPCASSCWNGTEHLQKLSCRGRQDFL